MRVEVSDFGPGFEPPSFGSASSIDPEQPSGAKPRHSEQSGGRGLYLVDRLSDSWGVYREEFTCVWFEMVLD